MSIRSAADGRTSSAAQIQAPLEQPLYSLCDDLVPDMAGSDPHDADDLPPSEQGDRPEISIVREDAPSLSIGCLEDLLIAAALPSLLLYVGDVKPAGSQVGDHFRVDVLVREPTGFAEPYAVCSPSGMTRSCFKASAAYR